MSRTSEEQISQLLSVLQKNLQATKNQDDLSSESEFEINGVENYEVEEPVVKKTVRQKKNIPDEPVGQVSHQKFCIRCGSADNLFRNNKYKTCVVCCNKTKRPPQSENQKKAFEKCREVRLANVQKRKEALREFEEKAKQELDTKIVRKAVAVKKKQILREAQLEEVSDEEETPLEEVVEVAKKTAVRKSRKSIPAKRTTVTHNSEAEVSLEPQVPMQYYVPQFSFA